MTRLFALLGSGEFEPWTEQADRWLLERATGGGGVLILPAASAPEGDQVFDMWADMGLTHYDRLGIPAEVVLLKTRSDAEDPAFVSKLESASVAYFSGGNPAYLAQTLSGSAFWEELLRQVGRGMAYAGCSAGVACLGELAPDSSVQDFTQDLWRPGLRLFPGFSFGPHWDALDTYVPGLRDIIVAAIPQGQQLLGIDEHTAMVGDGNDWTMHGSGGAHLRLDEGAWKEFGTGTSFSLSLLPA